MLRYDLYLYCLILLLILRHYGQETTITVFLSSPGIIYCSAPSQNALRVLLLALFSHWLLNVTDRTVVSNILPYLTINS
jgi:hypothetical protein